ncbi:MAG: carotenoid 1,2-hydratase [Gammaproteobacteria bacterium]|nr:carotenoid 1,2-hydratase [Gammaproteobacteria bacterium]
MSERRSWLIAGGVLALLGAGCRDEPPRKPDQFKRSIADTLSDSGIDGGFRRARRMQTFRFPADHGAHPEFRNEWWYLTGNLATPDRRRFGYQVTLFRSALSPDTPHSRSAWATNQVYLAHVAVTDVARRRFHSAERIGRGALGLAGAETEPVRLWLDDWSIVERSEPIPGCRDCLAAAVNIGEREFALSLSLTALKAPALHGDRGLSAKGPSNQNASYYYSYTRMATRGTITVDGTPVPVRGSSWFDHEWSTSALSPGQSGWDWFSIQLSDDTEVMLFRLRDRDLASRDFLSGSMIDPNGRVTPVSAAVIEALSTWRSPSTGVAYPSGWRIVLPGRGLQLTLTPLLENQEIDLMFRYWEGAVAVTGSANAHQLRGYGYAELTGYE